MVTVMIHSESGKTWIVADVPDPPPNVKSMGRLAFKSRTAPGMSGRVLFSVQMTMKELAAASFGETLNSYSRRPNG